MHQFRSKLNRLIIERILVSLPKRSLRIRNDTWPTEIKLNNVNCGASLGVIGEGRWF